MVRPGDRGGPVALDEAERGGRHVGKVSSGHQRVCLQRSHQVIVYSNLKVIQKCVHEYFEIFPSPLAFFFQGLCSSPPLPMSVTSYMFGPFASIKRYI